MCSHCGWLLLKSSAVGIEFNEAETNCGIAHILGILLMNSYNTDIICSNYYHFQSVHFEYIFKSIPYCVLKYSNTIEIARDLGVT